MILKNKIFVGLIFAVFFALIFALGFNMGRKSNLTQGQTQTQSNYCRIDPETSKIIETRYFYFTGQVSEVDLPNNAITLSNGGESLKIDIKKDTKIISYAFRPEDKTPNDQPKIFLLKDILIEDKVSVYAEVQKNGKPLGTSVYVHFVPVKAF